MRTYYIESYGCQMNLSESAAIASQFDENGWEKALTPEDAAVIIINTCSVRKTAEDRIWGRLGYYKRLKKTNNFRLYILGCMGERLNKEIKIKFPVVDEVISNYQKHKFARIINDAPVKTKTLTKEKDFGKYYKFFEYHNNISKTHAMVPIMNGCNNYCSYCVVPFVRGKEVSRNGVEILHEILAHQKNGISEITLLGQNVNSYKRENINFSKLLSIILKETDIKWFRFTSSNPQDFTDELIELIDENKRLCSFIHLPVQHGSNKILKTMNRKYTSEEYLELVQKLKKLSKDIALSTDLMVGFPGETEKDYEQLIELVEKVRFEEAFTYYYNPREGTAAYSYDDSVPKKLKLERLSKLIKLQRKISLEEKQKRLGKTVEAIAESPSKKDPNKILARTEKNSMVIIPKNNIELGDYINIKLNQIKGNTFLGEEVNV